jgi:hypothetical protein
MPEARCVICGCTESRACEGGCSWASRGPAVCSRCAGRAPFEVVRDGEDFRVSGPGSRNVLTLIFGEPQAAAGTAAALNKAWRMGVKLGAAMPAAAGKGVRSS